MARNTYWLEPSATEENIFYERGNKSVSYTLDDLKSNFQFGSIDKTDKGGKRFSVKFGNKMAGFIFPKSVTKFGFNDKYDVHSIDWQLPYELDKNDKQEMKQYNTMQFFDELDTLIKNHVVTNSKQAMGKKTYTLDKLNDNYTATIKRETDEEKIEKYGRDMWLKFKLTQNNEGLYRTKFFVKNPDTNKNEKVPLEKKFLPAGTEFSLASKIGNVFIIQGKVHPSQWLEQLKVSSIPNVDESLLDSSDDDSDADDNDDALSSDGE